MLLGIGLLLLVIGGVVMLAEKVPWLGRLPGDVVIEKKNFSFYFPLATCLFVSALLSFFFWLFRR
jgi:hypothetical protein